MRWLRQLLAACARRHQGTPAVERLPPVRAPTNPPTCPRSDEDCDLRIRLMEVARYHCRLSVAPVRGGGAEGEAPVFVVRLTSISRTNPTYWFGEPMERDRSLRLAHGDVFTISGRSFRVDYRPAARTRLAALPAEADEEVRRATHARDRYC